MRIMARESNVAGRARRCLPRRARSARPNSERGSAVIVVLVLVCIMVLFIAANTATLNWLRSQLKLVEQQQTQRLNGHAPANPPASK